MKNVSRLLPAVLGAAASVAATAGCSGRGEETGSTGARSSDAPPPVAAAAPANSVTATGLSGQAQAQHYGQGAAAAAQAGAPQ